MLAIKELQTMRDNLQRNMFAGVQELQLPDRTVASPAVSDGHLFIRGRQALYSIGPKYREP